MRSFLRVVNVAVLLALVTLMATLSGQTTPQRGQSGAGAPQTRRADAVVRAASRARSWARGT